MRNVIVSNIVTLDGYTAGEGGNPMVLNMDAAFDAYNLERMRTAGTILLGRSSFELFGSFWPGVADAPDDPANPALSATNREFSRLYRGIRKVVVSDTLQVPGDHPWADTTDVVARSDAAARLATERATDGGDILVFASHILWNVLLSDGQLDELHLMIGPHAIGSGVSAFTGPAKLELIETRRFDGSDNVLHSYRPVR
jgi:dihydrofolate reductase